MGIDIQAIKADSSGWTTVLNTTSSSSIQYPGYYFNPVPKYVPKISLAQPDQGVERQVSRYFTMPSQDLPPQLQHKIALCCKQYGTSGEVILEAIRLHVLEEKAEWDQDLPAEPKAG